jgi:hypothetical protein
LRLRVKNLVALPSRESLRLRLRVKRGRPPACSNKHPDVVQDLEARLLAYARQQKMSEWLKSQVDYLGFQGETVLDPGYNIDG